MEERHQLVCCRCGIYMEERHQLVCRRCLLLFFKKQNNENTASFVLLAFRIEMLQLWIGC